MNLLAQRRNMAHNSCNSTKSIDVGGVFFMDLVVNNGSDFNDDFSEQQQQQQQQRNIHHHHQTSGLEGRRRMNHQHHHQDKSIRLSPSYLSNDGMSPSQLNCNNKATSIVDRRSRATSMAPAVAAPPSKATTTTTQPPSNDYLGSSLDRLASVINCDGQQDETAPADDNVTATTTTTNSERSLTIVRPQKPYDFKELQSSCSLSDESYVASGEASLSASLAGSSEQDYEDRGSTTTREDSGVLDMKDLEGQLNNQGGSYEVDEYELNQRSAGLNSSKTGKQQPLEQEKSISKKTLAANLINNSANGNINFQYQQHETINYNNKQQQQHRSINKPTDGNSNANLYHNNHRNDHSTRRTVSASLPIQVPTRQMKKNLNRMKLNLMRDDEEELQQQQLSSHHHHHHHQKQHQKPAAIELIAENNSPVRKGDRNRPAIENLVAFDDDDAFLNQEFNANHNNHYPIDELDREHLTAEEDPMRLFASIQALARSLHEDAELFGSLPPKRMLESPIRSIALV